MGLTPEELLEAREAAASYRTASLDAAVTGAGDDAPSMIDVMGSPDPGFDGVAERDAIRSAWRELSGVERRVLELRFFHDMTQREIGAAIGFSQMHVSRVLRRAMKRLEQATTSA
jgi:RNA polymerase sigma-B factor